MKREIKVGLDFAAPIPLHTDISSGVFEGFEVDLLKRISELMEVKLTYDVSLWAEILKKLESSEIDLICSAVTVTSERRQYLDFSQGYVSFRLCVVSERTDLIRSLAELSGKHIGVRKSTEAETFVNKNCRASNTLASDTNEELYELLTLKKIDAVVDDSPIAGAFAKSNPNLIVSLLLPGTESKYAIALRQGNTALRNNIDKILTELKADGFLDALHIKWFSEILL